MSAVVWVTWGAIVLYHARTRVSPCALSTEHTRGERVHVESGEKGESRVLHLFMDNTIEQEYDTLERVDWGQLIGGMRWYTSVTSDCMLVSIRWMQMISFLYVSIYLVLFSLAEVLSDYPFTVRPINRSTRRDVSEDAEFASTTRKQSDVQRRGKPPYQGYLAFMLICGKLSDRSCIDDIVSLNVFSSQQNQIPSAYHWRRSWISFDASRTECLSRPSISSNSALDRVRWHVKIQVWPTQWRIVSKHNRVLSLTWSPIRRDSVFERKWHSVTLIATKSTLNWGVRVNDSPSTLSLPLHRSFPLRLLSLV